MNDGMKHYANLRDMEHKLTMLTEVVKGVAKHAGLTVTGPVLNPVRDGTVAYHFGRPVGMSAVTGSISFHEGELLRSSLVALMEARFCAMIEEMWKVLDGLVSLPRNEVKTGPGQPALVPHTMQFMKGAVKEYTRSTSARPISTSR